MTRNVIFKLDSWAPSFFLLGPFFFFIGYFDGIKFNSFSAPTSAFGVLLVILVAARHISFRNFNFKANDILVLAIVVYFLLTALHSDYTLLSLKRWTSTIVSGASFYFLGRCLINPNRALKNQIHICGTSIAILFLYALCIFALAFPQLNGEMMIWLSDFSLFPDFKIGQTYAGRFIGNYFIYRPSSLFSNPNGLALFAMLSFALSLLNWNRRSKWCWITIVVILTVLLWTVSRAALLGIVVFLISYSFSMRPMLRRYIPFIMAVAICVPIIFYIYTSFFFQPVALDDNFEIFELRERAEGWKVALSSFQPERWLLGAGFGVSREAVLGVSEFVFSIWIVLLLEVGIIGTGLVIFLWLLTIFNCFKYIRECKETSYCQKANAVILALLLALLVHQAFDLSAFRFHPLNFLIFSLIGIATNAEIKPKSKLMERSN